MTEYPRFFLRLPKNGPTASGRLLDERGMNGSKTFVIDARSPVRSEHVNSFLKYAPDTLRRRNEALADGSLVESGAWPGYLETTRDIECGAPSDAAAFVMGRNANGWTDWRTEEGKPLGDFMDVSWQGSKRSVWLVRGSNVNGQNLVDRLWRPDGLVTLSASRLPQGVVAGGFPSKEAIRTLVEEGYDASATYNQKLDLAEGIHAFVSRMKPGHTVVTISGGQVWTGKITGEAVQLESTDGRSNLRRAADWAEVSFDYDELPDEVQARLSDQHDVVDLTSVIDIIDALSGGGEAGADVPAPAVAEEVPEAAISPLRELELPHFDQDFADRLHVDLPWLTEVRQLLEEKQIVFYGPPGTGKTFLAQEIAERLAGGPENVELVQFHPSYSYEDFFEGFRPREDEKSGDVAFRLTAGPLRDIAERASREGNRHVPYFLIIDELNRANLAKVFGELYFLLEYRKRSVRLTYSNEAFFLPQNLFIIGTMNTVDRSIALVDAAMRRRFSFVELSPDAAPTKELLHRWLAAERKDPEPALLLDELNRRIEDKDFRIGPSYLMKKGVYRDGGLERAWRTKILPLLEEHHYGEGIDVERRYGLAALRRAIARNGRAENTATADAGEIGPADE